VNPLVAGHVPAACCARRSARVRARLPRAAGTDRRSVMSGAGLGKRFAAALGRRRAGWSRGLVGPRQGGCDGFASNATSPSSPAGRSSRHAAEQHCGCGFTPTSPRGLFGSTSIAPGW
jgi:hypothetical protein